MDVQFQQRLQDIFKSSTAKGGDCGISSSELGMVVNPFQSIPGYIGSGIPETKDFF